MDGDRVRSFLHRQAAGTLGRKHFRMRLAPETQAQELTGYGHNAVTPVGMSTPLPILLSHHIADLHPNFFWMGGGEVDLKLGMFVSDFVTAYKPWVLNCTEDGNGDLDGGLAPF